MNDTKHILIGTINNMTPYQARIEMLQCLTVYRDMYPGDSCKALRQLQGPYQRLKPLLNVNLDEFMVKVFENYEASHKLAMIERTLKKPREMMRKQGHKKHIIAESVSILDPPCTCKGFIQQV